ncbi:alkyl hydroperoxide reductase subunit F [Flammeovirga yaeyamensis]|uniref:Alkyl hydroperoxide reductase subunit F n=1 Tax=Flammeovirga yaeyamensis TaxID=367791 RepID=A0AAX1N9Q2_9BACT|nr:alkyl hydroperoxide reductase subunit F [Flammeovirga yaeyamensis]MBB3701238.1 alkyl hydroperoxide reductase subunit F [Flammeovirga yaeyamensis]NMF38291.1 alkyl hydroperoxide reductase subunit F [Flammeovirga yaeyamensis]QWG02703.1 alkyl hydroperoxide reductase subunit F [Flammeovirga yaeyamensis]
MLEQALKTQVTTFFGHLKSQYTFEVTVADTHPSKNDMVSLMEDVASCSDKVTLNVQSGEGLSMNIVKDGVPSNITFRAVPTGHEFTTLLLAVLNMEGIGKNLPDQAIINKIKSISEKVEIRSYISLSCTNCPEVVQALNVMSMNNPNITHQIIDGGINQEEVEQLGIQAVPTVLVNGEQFHVGRSSLGELLGKLEELVETSTENIEAIEKEYDVVVVGGGPAGVSSAVYSARKGFKVAVVAGTIGGQVKETVGIENMISITKTTGAELTANLYNHLKDYPIDILENRWVENVEVVDGYKKITTSMNEVITAPALVIATGASWRKLGVPGETEYIGSGVAFCTHCDAPYFKGKKVVVVGGGNSGLEAAIDLSSIASEVTVLEFMDTLKGDQVLQDKVNELPNVNVITNAATKEVIGDGKQVTALQYQDRVSEEIKSITTDGVFVQIGLKANSDAFKDIVETNRMGEIEIDAHNRTSQAGVYAAGDVSIVPYKQIVIAMGEGSKAALSAFEDKIKNKLMSTEISLA